MPGPLDAGPPDAGPPDAGAPRPARRGRPGRDGRAARHPGPGRGGGAGRRRPDQRAVGAEHARRRSRLVGDPRRRGDRRGDRQRGEPVRQRPVGFGHHRPRLHRRVHQPVQRRVGRARYLDGVADRRARPRRGFQRHHRHGARGPDPVDPGDPRSRRPALRQVRARAGDRHPAVAGRRDQVRGDARREGHQHVDRLQLAERHGPGGAAGRLRPRRGGARLGRQLGRPGLERPSEPELRSPSPPAIRA